MSLSPRAIGPFRYSLLDSEPFYETRMSLLWLADAADQRQGKTNRVVIKVARLKEEQYSLVNERAINNEERWLRKLHHPGIIKLLPIAEEGKTRPGQEIYRARSSWPGNPWFVVTDYLPGGTLHELVQERKKLNLRLALQITHDLADTLAYIHSQGCIHQDFKPRNVLFVRKPQTKVTHQSRPILIDFGIAGQRGEQHSISGTRPWLAPESERANRNGTKMPATPAMDIYALGVVLYYMLTGKRPPEATPNIAARLHMSANELVDLPSHQQSAIIDRLNRLIGRCVHDDPEKRPTAHQVLHEVEQLLSLVQKPRFFPLRTLSPWLAGVLGMIVLLIAIVIYTILPFGGNGAGTPTSEVVTPATPPGAALPAAAPPLTSPVTSTVTLSTTANLTTTTAAASPTPVVPTPTTVEPATPTIVATATVSVTATLTLTTTLTMTPYPTSTLAPTATPTATPTPRPTFTPTVAPPTPTPAA